MAKEPNVERYRVPRKSDIPNATLVWWVINHFHLRNDSIQPIDDVMQHGFMALIRANRGYKHVKSKFSTYATVALRREIRRIFGYGIIHIPPHVMPDIIAYKHAEKYFLLRGIPASEQDIADKANLTPERFLAARRYIVCENITSLDDVEDPKNQQPSELIEKLRNSLKLLDDRTSEIMHLRYGIGHPPHTLEEVGAKFKLTRERVRQIEAMAIRKLEHYITRGPLIPITSSVDVAASIPTHEKRREKRLSRKAKRLVRKIYQAKFYLRRLEQQQQMEAV